MNGGQRVFQLVQRSCSDPRAWEAGGIGKWSAPAPLPLPLPDGVQVLGRSVAGEATGEVTDPHWPEGDRAWRGLCTATIGALCWGQSALNMSSVCLPRNFWEHKERLYVKDHGGYRDRSLAGIRMGTGFSHLVRENQDCS